MLLQLGWVHWRATRHRRGLVRVESSGEDLGALGDPGRGLSRRNLFYMRQFAALWPDEQIVQTLSAQIGWSHHQVLLDAFGDAPDLYAWYAAKAVENRWAVRQLRGQIDLKLHLRAGAATANYAATLGEIEGRAALTVTKNPMSLTYRPRGERQGAPTRRRARGRDPTFSP
jgi:hypothetical protein